MNTYKKACQKAQEIDEKLTAYDERFKGILEIRHADGSFLLLQNAFSEIHRIDGTLWQLVFTEHCGFIVFADEDVTVCAYRHKGDISESKSRPPAADSQGISND